MNKIRQKYEKEFSQNKVAQNEAKRGEKKGATRRE
jgi:hypothetical protein